MRDKLESNMARDWCLVHDIVVLSETKTPATPSMPGFVAINNSKARHGGVAVLIKRWLYSSVRSIDVTDEGAIWFELSLIPGVRFCGMYNEPTDSPYFREATLASIPAHLADRKSGIIVGDLNTRLGSRVQELGTWHPGVSYDVNDKTVNANGRTLIDLCVANQLLPVNNLHTSTHSWGSSLTYRKKNIWISEVDYCIVSKSLINSVEMFTVDQRTSFPSDHAPVSVGFDFSYSMNAGRLRELVDRAKSLGSYQQLQHTPSISKKPIPFAQIHQETFLDSINRHHIEEILVEKDLPAQLGTLNDILYESSAESKQKIDERYKGDQFQNRWKRIKDANDSKTLWRGIDWNGKYREVSTITDQPSEAAFQTHLEKLMNPTNVDAIGLEDFESQVSLASLDDPFRPEELLHVVDKQVDPGKSCGIDGTSPGVVKLLPAAWMGLLLHILNAIFLSGTYPLAWATSKLIMLFKKGLTMCCGNYRGISIIVCLAKIYDYLLNNRLTQWYTPCREQAGAQLKRGCVEHIVTLRLIIDRCAKKKTPLYVGFIDFSKAYDRVDRRYLISLLRKLGCGRIMLRAIASMYHLTQFLLGVTIVVATLGVKQGSPTSCFLFILFVDEFIKLVKQSADDGFLTWLHLLMLMDDTVIVATSREKLCEKLSILVVWCNGCGMVINEDKTKFMAFNCVDTEPIVLETHAGRVVMKHCFEYVYLGAVFTQDGKVQTSVSRHAKTRVNAMNKLVIFLNRNENAPYDVKKQVLDACFNTSLLYGCESWLGVQPSSDVKRMYMKGIRMLLGVRCQITQDVCLLESGYPSFEATVRSLQQKFFKKMIEQRKDMTDDPLMWALEMTRLENPAMSRYINRLVNDEEDIIASDLASRVDRVTTSSLSKVITYRTINPAFEVHSVYSGSIPEDTLRIAFTRFRTSSY